MQDIKLKAALKNWRPLIKKYQKPDHKKAIIQLFNSFLPFIGLWILMYFSLNWSYLLTLGLAVIAAFFLIRIFVIQHDCGHQSFTASRKANNIIGFTSSCFSTIPYKMWRQTHNLHHAHNGQLEHRGLGDIFFLTKEEYHNRSKKGKMRYRIFRTPLVQFLFSPIVYLTIAQRYPMIPLKNWDEIRKSHVINNVLLIVVYGTLALVLGWQKFLLVHVPTLFIFVIIAYWLFYVQHQHEENYKEEKDSWNHLLASVRGSTYYQLPKLFQWLSGNIGFHHIHHLNSSIPNYHLEACAKENPILSEYANTLSFKDSLKCFKYKLWDDQAQRMISFKEYERMVGEMEV